MNLLRSKIFLSIRTDELTMGFWYLKSRFSTYCVRQCRIADLLSKNSYFVIIFLPHDKILHRIYKCYFGLTLEFFNMPNIICITKRDAISFNA